MKRFQAKMIRQELRKEIRANMSRTFTPQSGYLARSAEEIRRRIIVDNAFQWAEHHGRVRIRVEPDDMRFSMDDLIGEFRPEDFYGNVRAMAAAKRQAIHEVEHGGVWYMIAEYCDDSGNWRVADSIGGLVGYDDPTDSKANPYVTDMREECLSQLRQYAKSKCPKCGRRC